MGSYNRKSGALALISALLLSVPAGAVTQAEFLELCLSGSTESVAEALQDSKISATSADAKGNTPLMMASQARGDAADPAKIQLIIARGGKPATRNKEGLQSLALAARSTDNPEIIIELVRAGANLEDKATRGWTPVSFAAARNPSPAIINVLFDLGADINVLDSQQSSPLMLAVRGGNTAAVINALLDNGADPLLQGPQAKIPADFLDAKKYTPEELEVLKTRLKQENPPSPVKPERFREACRYGIEPRIRYFLQARTDPNAPTGANSPILVAASENPWPGVIPTLAQYGAIVDVRDENGRTPLICAARSARNPSVLTELILAGARPDFVDNDGKNALDYASSNPAFSSQDLQLLTSMLNAITAAEKRGAQKEIDRRNSDEAEPTRMTRLGELYSRMAADQSWIVRLADSAAQIRREAAETFKNERAAQIQASNLQERLDEEKELTKSLTEELEALKEEQRKDTLVARENSDRLTGLWQEEMQKNLKLATENTEDFQKQKEQFEAEKTRIEESYRAEIEDLRARLAEETEKVTHTQEELTAAELRYKEQSTAEEERLARTLEDNKVEYERLTEELKEQHQKELEETIATAKQQHESEMQSAAAAAEEHEKTTLAAERERHSNEMTQQRLKVDAEWSARLANLEKTKNSEIRQKTDERLQETTAQKIQFADVLTVLNAFLRRERDASAKARADFNTLKARSEKEKVAMQEHLKRQQIMNEAELAERLAEQEDTLRAEFAAEAARLKEEYRNQLRDSGAKFEAQVAEEISHLKVQHEKELNEKTAELYEIIERLKTVPVPADLP